MRLTQLLALDWEAVRSYNTGAMRSSVRQTDLPVVPTIGDLVAACRLLGAAETGGPLSADEKALLALPGASPWARQELAEQIQAGADPLGDAFCLARDAVSRRERGAFYTPEPIVAAMVAWLLGSQPARVVDAGCGSGRFAVEVARRRPDVAVVAADLDPVATLMCRAALAAVGASRADVRHADYTTAELPPVSGRTAFISNPPYVRHHGLTAAQKRWGKEAGERVGIRVSGLAGLHVYFMLATLLQARPGDTGCYITSAEWLDVGYGSALRDAFVDGLGGLSLHLLDRRSETFGDAMSTALVSCFQVGTKTPSVTLVPTVGELTLAGEPPETVRRTRVELAHAKRWSGLFWAEHRSSDCQLVPLGQVVRVSRGAVTGANEYFVMDRPTAAERDLLAWTRPALTRATEVLTSGGVVRNTPGRMLLLDPDPETELDAPQCRALRRYLEAGEQRAISQRYVCSHRSPWWRVAAKAPPIVATYMARQAPAFALNADGLATVNVIHGLFPHQILSQQQLAGLVGYLNRHRDSMMGAGRTYQGGLVKFEPSELEALRVPPPDQLADHAGEIP